MIPQGPFEFFRTAFYFVRLFMQGVVCLNPEDFVRKLILISALLIAFGCLAQDPTGHGGGGTLTRQASRYMALETALLQAQQDRNQNAASRLVGNDFEIWSAESADAMPREVWEQGWQDLNLTWFRIRNIAVREFGDTAVISFLLDRRGDRRGRAIPATVYVVDVWQQQAGKLAVRYLSTPGKPALQLMPANK